jgi:tetratricopeptide (TPR) repeat protein
MNRTTTMTRAFAACLLTAALAGVALAGDAPSYTLDTDPLRLANKALEKGALDEARSRYEEAVAAGYKLADAHTGLATIAVREGRFAEAEAQFRLAIDAGGGRAAEAHAGLGVVLLRRDQTEAAAAEFTAALAIDADNWLAHYGRARLHLARAEWSQAEAELARGKTCRGVAEHEDLYQQGRALLLLGTGDTAEAEKAALQAVSLNPANPENGEVLARIYTQRGVPALAIAAYEQALTAPGVQPTAPMLHQLGNLYRSQQRYNEARDQYLRAAALDSNYVPVYRDLADLLRRADRHEMAARAYLRYVADAPTDTSAWIGLATSLTALHRYDQACDAAAHARRLDPASVEAQRAFVRAGLHATDPAVKTEAADLMASLPDDGAAWTAAELLDLAAVQMDRKAYDAADSTLARAAAADSTLYQVPFQQGVLALRMGRPQVAVAHFERAAGLAPESAPVQLDLGIAHYQAGQIPEAIAALHAAVERDPTSTTARVMLAQTLAAAGDTAAAEREYREVLSQQPDSAPALRGLGFCRLRAADYQGAVTSYTQATVAEPNSADGWAGLGSAQLGLGNLDAAESAFARARSLDPKNVMLQKGTELLNQARSARKENQPR